MKERYLLTIESPFAPDRPQWSWFTDRLEAYAAFIDAVKRAREWAGGEQVWLQLAKGDKIVRTLEHVAA